MGAYTRDGGRTVELYIPFDFQGRRIDAISIGPFLLDHTLRWQEGKFRSSLSLLADLSGMAETVLRQMRYPDVDRVFGVFLDMLPETVRDMIARGEIPLPPEGESASVTPPEPTFNPSDPWANMPKTGPAEEAGPVEPPADPDRPPGTSLGFGLDLS